MNENANRIPDDADPWTIPLHGAIVPLPPTADVPRNGQPKIYEGSGADAILDFPASDEVPSDVGFHPRLRRSA